MAIAVDQGAGQYCAGLCYLKAHDAGLVVTAQAHRSGGHAFSFSGRGIDLVFWWCAVSDAGANGWRLYTFPLFVGLFGLVAGEAVGPRRIVAILAGFIGTLLVLRPNGSDFSMVALMPVGAGFCYALFVVTTRRLCRDESPLALVLSANIMIASAGLLGMLIIPLLPVSDLLRSQYPFLLTTNEKLVVFVVVVILSSSVLNTIGNLCLSKAYQSADSSFLAPIDYSYLLFATAWGVVLFGDIPAVTTVAGLVLIAAAGLFVAWRERKNI